MLSEDRIYKMFDGFCRNYVKTGKDTFLDRLNILADVLELSASDVDERINFYIDSNNSNVTASVELDDRFAFSFDEIGDEVYIDARANYAPIYLEDELVIGNGAGMQYDVIVAIPRSADHWQMSDKVQDSLDKHIQDVTDGTDYYGSAIVTGSHVYPKYANIPDDVYEDSVFYSATIEVVPYDNIGPDGTYGINYAYDYE